VHTHPDKSDSAKAWTNDNLLNKERGLPQPFKEIIDNELKSNTSITVVDCYCNLQLKFHDLDVKILRMKVTDRDEFQFFEESDLFAHYLHSFQEAWGIIDEYNVILPTTCSFGKQLT
jgi:hypothetical protein